MFFLGRMRAWWVAKQRDLFVFWDGRKWRRGDPVRIGTRLEETCPTYLEILSAVVTDVSTVPIGTLRNDAIKAKSAGAKVLAETALKIFDLKPLSDTEGVTDGEALGVLTQYFVFMERLARDANLFTGSPQPTA